MRQADELNNGVREIWHPVSKGFNKNKVKDLDQGISDGGGTIDVSLVESRYAEPWLFIEAKGEYMKWDHDSLLQEAEQILLKA